MRYVSATDAKQRFAEVIDAAQREPVVIRRQKRDVAVVLSPQEYDRLRAANVAELERQLVARAEDLRDSAGAAHLLVRWQIAGAGPLVRSLGHEEKRRRIIHPLRERFGHAAPCLVPAATPPLFDALPGVLRSLERARQGSRRELPPLVPRSAH